MKFVCTLVGALTLGSLSATAATARGEAVWTVSSPDGKNVLSVRLSAQGALSYFITRSGDPILAPSPLGVRRDDLGFETNLVLVSAGPTELVRQDYHLVHGKRRHVIAEANGRSLVFASHPGQGERIVLDLRVANDGAAFRYRFPNTNAHPRTVLAETTGFAIPQGARGWMQPQDAACAWAPGYEDTYLEVTPGMPAPQGNAVLNGIGRDRKGGWVFPALFRLAAGRHWLLLTESGVDGEYCASHLGAQAPGGVYQIAFPNPEEVRTNSPVEPSSSLPWTLPWRVIIMGDTPAVIAESTLVTDLAPPCRIADVSWIQPGRAAWSWWSDQASARHLDRLIPFVDLAADFGWEHCLLDAGWPTIPATELSEQLIARAKAKGVKVHVWQSARPMYDPLRRREWLDRVAQLGLAGIKVDFWCSDKQETMRTYLAVLEDAAARHLMVNFHGCTLPRGWERTWPNLMSQEAVLGAESYLFFADYPKAAPRYHTLLPFTRNAVGPMDFTPVAFSDGKYPHVTTHAYELALSVVFESGLVHFADSVAAYRQQPQPVTDFLRSVPAAWDETRCLVGEPGERVVMARRQGSAWWVGAINGTDQARTERVRFSFLGGGRWKGSIIQDADVDRAFACRSRTGIRSNDTETVPLRPFGGFVLHLTPQ